jgi:hypothetical protein
MTDVNDHLVCLVGKSAAGKSASLMQLRDPTGVWYLNCESGKRLPFPAKFKNFTITDPMQVMEAFTVAEGKPEVHTIVVDSLTYLLDMYESMYVIHSTNTMKAWGDFAQYFKVLMQDYVAKSTKKVIFTAHTLDTMNEAEMVMETKIPVKGSLKNNGIESYFSVVIAAKKMNLTGLKDYASDLLNISEEEEALGIKYVYQTRLTKQTVNERLRGPLGLFSVKETFIDNDVQGVLDRLHEYYGTEVATV